MTCPVVLIADNDRAVSALLTEVLVRAKLQVRHAYDGEAARVMAAAGGIDVLVCDLDMPKLSGLEVLEAIGAAAVPAIVVSGYLDGPVLDRLGALSNVREVLRKPFDLLAFADKVQRLAEAHWAGRRGVERVPQRLGSAEQ